ncbi:MAG TPA: SHOCT domain-containing protein [Acidimicrobiales bacterium]|nr:SHOCT domain-containing protein [Acidimicrobiales bacterium]
MLRFFLVAGAGFVVAGLFAVQSGNEGAGIAGGTFLMIGVIWVLVAVGVGGFYAKHAKKQADDRRLYETGSRARGVIEEVEQTATSINDMPVFNLVVRIELEGGDSFVHRRRLVTPTSAMPVPGQVVNVAYDPRDRTRVAYETRPGLAALPAEVLAVRSAGGSNLDDLERLARLRDQGVLTEDEFREQKARLLEG